MSAALWPAADVCVSPPLPAVPVRQDQDGGGACVGQRQRHAGALLAHNTPPRTGPRSHPAEPRCGGASLEVQPRCGSVWRSSRGAAVSRSSRGAAVCGGPPTRHTHEFAGVRPRRDRRQGRRVLLLPWRGVAGGELRPRSGRDPAESGVSLEQLRPLLATPPLHRSQDLALRPGEWRYVARDAVLGDRPPATTMEAASGGCFARTTDGEKSLCQHEHTHT